jgi:eukaryotic-like serine/threonine-protein kinase
MKRTVVGVLLFTFLTCAVALAQRGAPVAVGGGGRQITIYDRQGTVVKKVGAPGPYNVVALSPDGKRVAAPQGGALFVYDIATGMGTRVAPGPGSTQPAWSADSKSIVYQANRPPNGTGFYKVLADGTAMEELVFAPIPQPNLTGFAPDGKFITYHGPQQPPRGTGIDLWVVPTTGDKTPISILSTPRNESGGRISPDGKLIAFRSDESGRYEVYVRPFNGAAISDPENSPKLKLSPLTGTPGAHGDVSADGKTFVLLVPATQ